MFTTKQPGSIYKSLLGVRRMAMYLQFLQTWDICQCTFFQSVNVASSQCSDLMQERWLEKTTVILYHTLTCLMPECTNIYTYIHTYIHTWTHDCDLLSKHMYGWTAVMSVASSSNDIWDIFKVSYRICRDGKFWKVVAKSVWLEKSASSRLWKERVLCSERVHTFTCTWQYRHFFL